MSTASRLISGSAASWVQIVVTMASQVALVPIYLSHWSIAMYGAWLAIQALFAIVSVVDYGHHEYLTFEFLRISRENRSRLSLYIWSGACFSLGISILQILLLVGFVASGALPGLLGKASDLSPEVLHEAGVALVLLGVSYLFSTSMTGLLFRSLASFGYYPRMAWWDLATSIVTGLVPAVAVLLGAGLLTTGIALTVATVVFSLPKYYDLLQLLRRERIALRRPSLKLGWHNFLRSLVMSGKWLLENSRQQGVRLVLAPLAGPVGLTAFSTMRTGSNVALQGLNTVVNPLMPELTRFLHQRDQERLEAAFSTVWFVLIVGIAPAMVLIQAFIEPLYLLWTRGRVTFNPALFALLSLSVLVYASAQPAIAVVRGNNLLRHQLLLSVLMAVVIVGGMYLLVPTIGLVGAGIALALAEVLVAIGYQVAARQWLQANGLRWPSHHSLIASTSVLLAAVAMGALVWLPSAKWLVLAVALVLLLGNCWRYWRALPQLATAQALRILSIIPGLKGIYAQQNPENSTVLPVN